MIDRIEGPFPFGTHVEGVPDGAELAFGPWSGEDGLPVNEFLVYIRREEMTNAKGPRFEALVRDYINEIDLNAERTGSELIDEGDIHFGIVISKGEWTIECKDQGTIDLPAYLRQLEASMVRKDAIPFKGAAVVKARGKNVSDAYAVMRLERYRQLAAYVIMLELFLQDYTGVVLPIPSELRRFLSAAMDGGRNEHLAPAFGEFVGPEEVEVLATGGEIPAGAVTVGEVCACGEVHTQQEIEDAEAFMQFLLSFGLGGLDDLADDDENLTEPSLQLPDTSPSMAAIAASVGGEVSDDGQAIIIDE